MAPSENPGLWNNPIQNPQELYDGLVQDPEALLLIKEETSQWSPEEKKLLQGKLQENKDKLGLFEENPAELKELLKEILKEVRWERQISQNIQEKTQVAQEKTQVAQEKTQVAQEKTQVAQEKTQVAQEKTQVELKDKVESSTLTEKTLERAKAQLETAYKSLGGKEKFEKDFANTLPQWRSEAEAQIKKGTNPPKTPEELEQKVQISLMLSHRDEIGKTITDPAKKREFQNSVEELRNSAMELGIQYATTPHREPITHSTEQKTREFLGVNQDTSITREGVLLVTEKDGKKIAVDTSKTPPERLVLSEGNLRASARFDSAAKVESSEKELSDEKEKQQMQSETFSKNLASLQDIRKISDFKNVSFDDVKITSVASIKTAREQVKAAALTVYKEANENQDPKALADIENLMTKKVLPLLESMEAAAMQYEISTKQIDTASEKLKSQKENAKKSQESIDSVARENLAFFESLGLSEWGQEKFGSFIRSFNALPNSGFNIDPKTIAVKPKKLEAQQQDGEYGEPIKTDQEKRTLLEHLLSYLPEEKDGKPLTLGDVAKSKDGIIIPPLTLTIDPNDKNRKTILQNKLHTLSNTQKYPDFSQKPSVEKK